MVRSELARLLRVDAERIPASALLSRLGVDSLMAVDLLGRIAQTLGVRLSPTLLFEHRTLAALCQAIERQKERG
jgi:acyl carrier protein